MKFFSFLLGGILLLLVSLRQEWHEEEALLPAKLLSILEGIWQLLVGGLWGIVGPRELNWKFFCYGMLVCNFA